MKSKAEVRTALIAHYTKQAHHHGRRMLSLDAKIEALYYRSPQVRRFEAMRKLAKRESEYHERALRDLGHTVSQGGD